MSLPPTEPSRGSAPTGVSVPRRRGRIEVICGCMFAGKTGRLIEELLAAEATGLCVVAFKHVIDDRYDRAQLVTHDERRFPALAVRSPRAVLDHAASVDVIGIDEAQFFGRTLPEVCVTCAARGQRVVVAGIDHDAWGRPFPPLPALKADADHVEVLHVPCTICGQPARYSQRMVPVTDEFMVGGIGDYQPRCAACFTPLPPPAPLY